MRDEVRVTCPKCGSDDIREKNVAYAELPVLGWEFDEDDGVPVPTDYDTDESPEWECADERYEYVCHGCRKWEGNLDDLAVSAPSPEERANG